MVVVVEMQMMVMKTDHNQNFHDCVEYLNTVAVMETIEVKPASMVVMLLNICQCTMRLEEMEGVTFSHCCSGELLCC